MSRFLRAALGKRAENSTVISEDPAAGLSATPTLVTAASTQVGNDESKAPSSTDEAVSASRDNATEADNAAAEADSAQVGQSFNEKQVVEPDGAESLGTPDGQRGNDGIVTTEQEGEDRKAADEPEDESKYPGGTKLALLTLGLCLATFVVALDSKSLPCSVGSIGQAD